ncbi:MAG: hypothetical protein AB1502_09790, partial [Thermodesulfobacteriota bacterium]
ITGSRDIMPRDKLTVIPGKIRMRVGLPIETQHFSLKDRKSLMEKVSEAITKNFKLISQEANGGER